MLNMLAYQRPTDLSKHLHVGRKCCAEPGTSRLMSTCVEVAHDFLFAHVSRKWSYDIEGRALHAIHIRCIHTCIHYIQTERGTVTDMHYNIYITLYEYIYIYK